MYPYRRAIRQQIWSRSFMYILSEMINKHVFFWVAAAT